MALASLVGLDVNVKNEATKVVSESILDYFKQRATGCYNAVQQTINPILEQDAIFATCGTVKLVAQANAAMECLQSMSNKGEAENDLATDIAKAMTDTTKTPLLSASLASANVQISDTDIQKTVRTTISASLNQACSQSVAQHVGAVLGQGAQLVSGCTLQHISALADKERETNDLIKTLVANGRSADEIERILGDTDRNPLAECCDPLNQGIELAAKADVETECTQVADIVDAIVNSVPTTVAVKQTSTTEPAPPLATETLIAIGAIVLGVLLLALVVFFVVRAAKNNPSPPEQQPLLRIDDQVDARPPRVPVGTSFVSETDVF